MFKFIETLRKKPEQKKQGIVLGISLSITIIIAVFWLIALIIKIRSGEVHFEPSIEDSAKFHKTTQALRNSWDSFTGSLNHFMEDTSATATSVPVTTVTVPESDIQ